MGFEKDSKKNSNQINSYEEKYSNNNTKYEYDGSQEYIVVSDSPLTTGEYLIMIISFMIPIFNIIMMVYWGFSNNINLNRKNFARAVLILLVVIITLSVLLGGIFISALRYYF